MRLPVGRLVLGFAILFPIAASAQILTAPNMSGGQEVPPADPDGTGSAVVTVAGTRITYTITTVNITLPPADQHIHTGAAGVDGPVFIQLIGTWTGGNYSGTRIVTQAEIDAILANPSGFYINVHTSDFPGGSIRGQLQLVSSTVPTMSQWALILLAAVLAFGGVLFLRRA